MVTVAALPDYLVTTPVFVDNTTHEFDTFGVFIHPHWYQFPLISPAWHYAMGIFITFVSVFGSLGNLLVMYIFGTTKSLRTPSNIFVLNLSMSDTIFSIINGFPLMTISCFSRRWIFGKVACELYGLVSGMFGLMSINTLAAIAFDRYNVIARPMKASRGMSYRRAFMMLMFVWCWSATWTIPPLFGWGAYIPEGFQTSCTFDYLTRNNYFRSYILCMYIFGFALPLMVILFCYVQIYSAVAKHEKEMGKMAKKLNAEIRQGQSAKRSEIKTAKVSLTIVLGFLLSWTPYATVALIAQFGPAELVTPYVSELPVMFAKASAMHNPVIYALSHPRFREAVDKRFPWLLCCCGVSQKEKEDAKMVAEEKSKMTRMDSVNSTAVGGTQSQLSEVSNLDSDEEPVGRSGNQMRNAKKEYGPAQPDNNTIIKDIIHAFAGAMTAQAGAHQIQVPVYLPPQMMAGQDPQLQQAIYAITQSANQGLSFRQKLVASTIHKSAEGKGKPRLYFPKEIMHVNKMDEDNDVKGDSSGIASSGREHHVLQVTPGRHQATLPPQVRTVAPESSGVPAMATTSVQPTGSPGVVSTQADVNGSYTNKAYQTE